MVFSDNGTFKQVFTLLILCNFVIFNYCATSQSSSDTSVDATSYKNRPLSDSIAIQVTTGIPFILVSGLIIDKAVERLIPSTKDSSADVRRWKKAWKCGKFSMNALFVVIMSFYLYNKESTLLSKCTNLALIIIIQVLLYWLVNVGFSLFRVIML